MKKFKAPEKVVYAAMLREEKKDFIDYGVSIKYAWVTLKGHSFLNGTNPNHLKLIPKAT